ncbi:non-hydrolyzing UDP-N-acetylglucosamine 2-epimerase [Ekhidna sp.]|uniref:non-hydrolyzing UDP-N-acetylglucosamine 2-epimerase n=1 Tax=Ekhidna sp. TaxID=2608089 RepID=UPI003B5092E4
MPKISIILGTRPEAIKLIPLYKALVDAGHNVSLFSTGQHREMLVPIFDFFKVYPDEDLELMIQNQTLAGFSSLAFNKLDKLFTKDTADLYLVQGDTTTAMIAANVAFYQKRKLGHVEAGLRTGNLYSPYPEEFNRRVISITANYHFAPTQNAYDNLIQEKVNGKVWMTGNTVIDSLLFADREVKKDDGLFRRRFNFIEESNKNILITCHRRESFGDDLQQICQAIASLAEHFKDYIFIYPVHMNPNVSGVVKKRLTTIENLHLINAVTYSEMVYLMGRSRLILTDSGGIQEEAPSLNVPVVVMRNHTERQEGIEAGCAVLSGTQAADIIDHTIKILGDEALYSQMADAKNPYGNGTASKEIADIISGIL